MPKLATRSVDVPSPDASGSRVAARADVVDPLCSASARRCTVPWVRPSGSLAERYQPGDLFYGLHGPRHGVLADIKSRETPAHRIDDDAPEDGTALLWCDEEFALGGVEQLPVTADAVHDEALATGSDRSRRGVTTEYQPFKRRIGDPEYLVRYFGALEASRYDPRAFAGYEHGVDRIRKACKFGIEHTVSKDRTVHFLLDGLTVVPAKKGFVGRLVSRLKNPASAGRSVLSDKLKPKSSYCAARGRSITGSELRHIYRNRFRRAYRERVVFWKNGVAVAPPWEDSAQADAWKAYQPKNLYLDGPLGDGVAVAQARVAPVPMPPRRSRLWRNRVAPAPRG